MYPSFEELRSHRQRVVFSEDFKRLYWPLKGTFPIALAVMKTMRGALEDMEPLQRKDGSWHEISSLPLTEPKVSSIKASIPMLNQYEPDWVRWHEDHEATEYVAYGDLDDDTRPFGEQQEDSTWEADSDTEYLARCCGQDRPVHKQGLALQVKPAEGKEFVTIRDYVFMVHPWIMSLREDIIQAMIVAGDGRNMAPETARAMDWKISVRAAPQHDILTHKMWLSDHTKPTPLDEATRMLLRAAGTSRDLTWP
ncbi:LysM domain containing protein [Moelleriella libera RCEF 2490]|uniref:LysM domain containing protein n=1 Tax=Moelleriella libera RCEF 2490 TaxID=1081109 RepID=A0A167ZFM5_9HYPO|nr:LysM domain containing protein [Moelleriella libera RCEF 2490]